ncbi:hypothetical protein INT45_009653 [Circinella minor]|uniref:Uncharacterized protein n=1 Tax=Circinella minor TaxID=1195481 RepID=A0A8H7RTD8_9FUNG|nr:hypothetical protein INT45_009653 [Circinella minor]
MNSNSNFNEANAFDTQSALDEWVQTLILLDTTLGPPVRRAPRKPRQRVTEQEREEIFYLHFDEHLSVRDVVEITRIPLATVGTYIAQERINREINNITL